MVNSPEKDNEEPTSTGVPVIIPEYRPGLTGIEGKDLHYGVWFLLNEAFSCFDNAEQYGCIACLTGSVELWLRRNLKAPEDETLENLIKDALGKDGKGLISSEEASDLQALRKLRNSYTHFNLKKLPRVKDSQVTEYRISDVISSMRKGEYPKGKKVAAYPTPEFEDLIPLLALARYTQFFMETIKEFYQRRYPQVSQINQPYIRPRYWKRM